MTAPLLERVRARLVEHESDATPARVAAALRAEGLVLGDAAILDLVRSLRQELVGAGPLEPLLRVPGTTDVIVNGPASVWVDRGDGLIRTDVTFASEADVRRLAQRLAAAAGRRLDDAVPFVDARLPDGARLHCVIPPVAVDSTLISVRIPHRTPLTLADLVERGSMDEPGADVLRAMVRARLAILVSGGTGSGKTTVLSSLLGLVAEHERIVIVEDSTELAPAHPHAVRMQARMPTSRGPGRQPARPGAPGPAHAPRPVGRGGGPWSRGRRPARRSFDFPFWEGSRGPIPGWFVWTGGAVSGVPGCPWEPVGGSIPVKGVLVRIGTGWSV